MDKTARNFGCGPFLSERNFQVPSLVKGRDCRI